MNTDEIEIEIKIDKAWTLEMKRKFVEACLPKTGFVPMVFDCRENDIGVCVVCNQKYQWIDDISGVPEIDWGELAKDYLKRELAGE